MTDPRRPIDPDEDLIAVRQRMTEGVNRARLRQELDRSWWPAAGVAAGFLLTAFCAWIIFTNITSSTGDFKSAYVVRFAVPNANGVVPDRNEVRLSGIPVGKITASELIDGQAVISARIQTKYGRVYRNARARLRPSTALNDMFLDIIERGSPVAGDAAGEEPLPAGQTRVAEGIGPVLQTFDADTRTRMHTLLQDLGGGLDGRGDELAEIFAEAVPFVRQAAKLTRELEQRDLLTRRLVTNTAELTTELGRRRRTLNSLVGRGARVTGALADQAPALDATLARIPGFLSTVRRSFAAARAALPSVDRAVVALRPVADEVDGGLTALSDLSDAGTPALRALEDPVARLKPLARVVPSLASSTDRVVDALASQTDAIEHVVKSTAGCGTPVNYFFQWTPSVFKLGDAYSGGPRGDATLGADSSTAVEDPAISASENRCSPGTVKGGTP